MEFALLYSFIGVVFIQVLFIIYQLFIFRRKELVYYLLYTLSISVFLIFQADPYLNPLKNTITDIEKFTLSRGLWFYLVAFYFRFGRNFCSMESLYPRINLIATRLETGMIIFGSIDMVTSYFYGGYYFSDDIVKYFVFAIVLFAFYVIGLLAMKNIVLNRILVSGSFCALAFGTACLVDMLLSDHKKSGLYYMQYHIVGTTLEFLFLNYGLLLKSKMIEKEKKKLELDKQFVIIKERERIISDLHDDMGGSLSSIRIISDLLVQQKDKLKEPEKYAQKISETANELNQKMKTLIWALDEENKSLSSFYEYVHQYAVNFFEDTGIESRFQFDEAAGRKIILNAAQRKNLFLCIKEILHNVLKHAKASILTIDISTAHKNLQIKIADNGIGIPENENHAGLRLGNGLKNLHKRVAEMNGSIKISNDNGAIVLIIIPI